MVIGPAENGNGVELFVHGAIVSILATMDTIKAMEAEFRTAQEYAFHNLIDKGVLDTELTLVRFRGTGECSALWGLRPPMVREFPLMLTDMVKKPQDNACYRMPGYDGDASGITGV